MNLLLGKEAITIGIKAGNVNISNNSNVEILDLNEESQQAQLHHAETLRKFESQKRARLISVPTSIDEVKQKLRELGSPVTLFGEDAYDRRERLKEVIATLEIGEEDLHKLQTMINQSSASAVSTSDKSQSAHRDKGKHQTQKETFYSNGSESLTSCRKIISEYSFSKAHDRISITKSIRDNEAKQALDDENTLHQYSHCKDVELNSSQVGDTRPLTCIRYSKDSNYLATGSLGSIVKVWEVTTMNCVSIGRGHEERITSVSWNPNPDQLLFASSSADKTCKIWTLNGENMSSSANSMDIDGEFKSTKLVHTLTGHTDVVTACEFHPMGTFIGTSSFDYTWRLWNAETGSELLLQDGHTKECSSLSFHHDGSLVLTGDSGGLVFVWDLRSGQCIQTFQGHIKKIVNSNFNINGFQVATCSVDNQVRIWDLRKKKCSYVVPAHSNAITDVRYSHSGELLVTSSFDGTIKVFGVRDYRLLNTFTGHLGKVMSCDISLDDKHFASAGYDRTFKLWAHKNEF